MLGGIVTDSGEDAPTAPPAAEVTAASFQTYLDRRFASADLRVRRCEPVQGGRSKSTVMVSLEPNGILPAKIVVRIDKPGSAQDSTVRDEYPVLAALHRLGRACVPEPLWLEAEDMALDAPFLAMRRMPGTPPGTLWSAEGVSPGAALGLAEALAVLHATAPRLVWPGAGEESQTAVAAMIDGLEASWQGTGPLPSLAISLAFAWFRCGLPDIEGPTVPVHGDTHFANVLVEDDTFVCLTDWEFAHPGHPAEDLAFCRPSVEQVLPWQDFLAHYRNCGGPSVSERALRLFSIWGYLRNAVFGLRVLHRFIAGPGHDIENLAIALHSRPRIEARLAEALARQLAADS